MKETSVFVAIIILCIFIVAVYLIFVKLHVLMLMAAGLSWYLALHGIALVVQSNDGMFV